MFWKYSNKENLAGHALSTVMILNNSGPSWACSGNSEEREFCFFFLFFFLASLKVSLYQQLLIRSVIAGLYVAFVSHLANV